MANVEEMERVRAAVAQVLKRCAENVAREYERQAAGLLVTAERVRRGEL